MGGLWGGRRAGLRAPLPWWSPGSPRTRPRRPRKRKSRLVTARRDRETSGICLKSIKENHYFLEENPLAIKARRRHPSAANRWLIQNSCTQPSPTLTDVVGPVMPLCKRDKSPALIYHCPKAAVGLGARLTAGTQLHHPRAGGLRAEFEPESLVLIAWPPSHLCHHQHGGMVGWMLRFWQVLCQGYL